ncbi:MAG: hypothetical protein C0501_20175 [Isosphaera sp.]|nr:hypothetical protein [Isosphaera sp.]
MLTVHLRVNDAATTRPTPVRVRITGPDGTHFAPLGRFPDIPLGRNEAVGGHLAVGRERWAYTDGACEVPLPAGVPLRFQVSKGPEYAALDRVVTLGPGQMAVRFAVERSSDPDPGRVAVDTRCHFLSPHDALLEGAAEGLDVVNLLATVQPFPSLDGTAYPTAPQLAAFSGQAPALERGGTAVVVNTFNTHPVLGKVALLHSHRPVFPLTFGPPEDTDDWGVCDWCDQCHRKGGLVVWVDAFEPAGGLVGGEALVAAVLGKVDAVEVTAAPRKAPLLPWVYRLWDSGVRLPLVGASGKDSNRVAVGTMRTDADVAGGTWVWATRAGRAVATAGPRLDLTRDGTRFRAAVRPAAGVELVADGRVIAAGREVVEAEVAGAGWVAARCDPAGAFAHTAPVAVGPVARRPEAVAALLPLVDQVREWATTRGVYRNPRRRDQLLARCAEAAARFAEPS